MAADLTLSTLVGGMNDFTAPEFLTETEYARGVNVSSRGGVIHTRPVFKRISSMPEGRFQGCVSFARKLYAFIAGEVHVSEDAQTWTVIPEISFSPYVAEIYTTPIYGDFLLCNDGVHAPAIVGGYANRHLSKQDDDPELPCGTLCCFGQGRIFFFGPYKQILQAGDIYKPGDPQSCLLFTEQAFLNESFSIDQPASYGEAQSMRFVRNYQSGTGLGQLVVFYEGGVCAYNVFESRAEWLNVQIGQSLFPLNGTGGQHFTAQVGNDLFFRSDTGLTTLRDYTSSSVEGIRTLPISIPITPLLSRDQTWTLDGGSIAVRDNRVLFTHGLRVDTDGDEYYDSLVSMDLSSFYSAGTTQMTFDGLFIGPKMTQVFTGNHLGNLVTFVTSKGEDNTNILWKLEDGIFDDTDVPPRSRLYTRRMSFTNAFLYSRFVNAEIWFQDMKSDVEVKLYFRGDSDLWQEASSGTFTVPYYDASAPTDGVGYILPQGRAKVRIPIPEDVCDPVTKRMLRVATSFQFCLEVTGYAAEPRMRFTADVPKNDSGEYTFCDTDSEDILLTDGTGGEILYDYDEGFLI